MARPYSQRADLNMDNDRLVQLTDSAAAPGVTDENLIAKLGVDADDLIDGMVGGLYVTPFDPVPPLVRLISRALWRVNLYEHRESIPMPPTVAAGGKWALDTLASITKADGGVTLVGAARVQSGSSGQGDPATPQTTGSIEAGCSPERKFGRKKDPLGG